MARRKVAILISGRGSNMATLIEAARAPGFPAEIALVLSNRPSAPGLDIAKAAGIETAIIRSGDYASREEFDASLNAKLTAADIDLICLAGFMRVLSAGFVDAWRDRLINIHPSLLPLFPGLETHEQALAAGVRIHGCTVHFVRAEIDSGPIILQAAVPVHPDDTPDALAERVLSAEHRIYPLALSLVAGNRIRIVDGHVVFDELPEKSPGEMIVSPL